MTDSFASSRSDSDTGLPTRGDSADVPSNYVASAGDRSRGMETPAEAATRRLTWLLIGLATLLVLRFLLPYFAEQIQYAMTRGKMRAELESAASGLETLKLDQLSLGYQMVSKRVAPSVVNINVGTVVTIEPQDERAFTPPRPLPAGQGSGVIVDADGYILTNNHVVHGATEIQVSLPDGQIVVARPVGADPLTDLALLKVDATKLVAAEWGDSDQIEVGALVWALGSPFGLEHSITAGILSGKNRYAMSGQAQYEFLQTDAAVNPGNSGGPLVDARGRVIGINTAIPGDAFQGISFAIPSNVARDVYEQLRAKGRVQRGWLGVSLGDVEPATAKQIEFSGDHGAWIANVIPDSPAAAAGLRPGDIVLRWDGQEIQNAAMLIRLVARTKIGATADVVIWRGGQELTLKVQVGERPSNLP